MDTKALANRINGHVDCGCGECLALLSRFADAKRSRDWLAVVDITEQMLRHLGESESAMRYQSNAVCKVQHATATRLGARRCLHGKNLGDCEICQRTFGGATDVRVERRLEEPSAMQVWWLNKESKAFVFRAKQRWQLEHVLGLLGVENAGIAGVLASCC